MSNGSICYSKIPSSLFRTSNWVKKASCSHSPSASARLFTLHCHVLLYGMRVLYIPFGPSFLYSIFLRFGTTSARSGGGGARPGGKAHERSGRGSLALCSCTKAACPHMAAHRRAHAPATPRGPSSWRAELCEWVDFQMNTYCVVHVEADRTKSAGQLTCGIEC